MIEGLYLVGSIALGDWQPSSDIDIVAFCATPPGTADVDALRAAHDATVADIGNVDIDGPRLAWNDITRRPAPIVRPWTLHGDFHHDDGCFEMNPVIWLTLAKYGVAVRGPVTTELDIAVDDAAVRSFVQANTESYWRTMAVAIDRALDDRDRTEFESDLTSWSVLGVARMLYTARTGGIASKSGAGRWILDELPEHRGVVEHALAIRAAGDAPPDDRTTLKLTAVYMSDVADLVSTETR